MRSALALMLAASLAGCGVALPYIYDSSVLDDSLMLTMTKAQVRKHLGNPDRVVQDNGQEVVWEYRLYPKREWFGYLIHCPFHPYCYFPGEPPSPYYLAFRHDQLCLWGPPHVVRTLVRQGCSLSATEAARRGRLARGDPPTSIIPVFMPPLIRPLPQRLAVIPSANGTSEPFLSWLDLILNFLRSRHPEMVLVERQALRALFAELGLQYGGRVDDETTVRIGKLAGADALLLYRFSMSGSTEPPLAAVELRLVQIESGTALFRQVTTVSGGPLLPGSVLTDSSFPDGLTRQLVLAKAASFGLFALTAAFGDNPLGIVPDLSWPEGGVKLLGILQESPAARSGLKPGDRILSVSGQPLHSWAMPIRLPASLEVERNGVILATTVGTSSVSR